MKSEVKSTSETSASVEIPLQVDRDQLTSAQKSDPTLQNCYDIAGNFSDTVSWTLTYLISEMMKF